MANYSCKSFPYELKLGHNTSVTDGRTDGRQPCQYSNSSIIT